MKNVWVSLLLLFMVAVPFSIRHLEELQGVPKPDEGDGENERRRALWYALIHKAAPGTDWRTIETQNQMNNIGFRYRYLTERGSDNQNESYADGALQGIWEEKGSDNQAGRNVEAEYDADNNDIYVITNNATLFKKNLISGGWSLLNPTRLSRNILKVVKKPDGTNRIIASLNSRLSYSDDNGKSFSRSSPEVINPCSLVGLHDAVGSLYCLTDSGIYISVDRGQSFSKIFSIAAGDGSMVSLGKTHNTDEVYLIDNRFSDGIKLYSINGNAVNLVNSGRVTEGATPCILRSVNVGGTTTWYALVNRTKVYRSTNLGASWVFRSAVPVSYTFEISMDDPQKLFVGGVEAWRSFDGGANWTLVNRWQDYYGDVFGKLHADIMKIAAFRKNDGSSILFINNDGGTAISNDNLTTTLNISASTLHNSEYYDVLTDQSNPQHVFAGSQDQGLQRNTNAVAQQGILKFEQVISGDYTQMAISGDLVRHLWTQYPGANVFYYDNSIGGLSLKWKMPGSSLPNAGWTMPITNTSDPMQDEVIMGGGDLSGGNGSYIMRLKPNLAAPFSITPTQYNFDFRAASNSGTAGVSAVGTVRTDSNKIYVATEDGTFFSTHDAGQSWTKAVFTGSVPGYLYGSCIYASRLTPDLVWFGGTGYSNAPVFRSTDGGSTLTAIRNGLPSTIINGLVANPSETMLFAATDAGPYVYIVSNDQWYSMIGSENPIHSYSTVQYIEDLNIVRFGTYSRGIWDFKISNALPPAPHIKYTGPLAICKGDSVTLNSSIATGNQWFKDGKAITGAVGDVYQAAVAGSYSVSVTANGLVSIPSTPVVISVLSLPETPNITASGPIALCEGSTVKLVSSSSLGNQWWMDGIALPGAIDSVFQTSHAGSYTVKVKNSNGCSTGSAAVDVTVIALPPNPEIRQDGGELVSSSSSGNQWFLDGQIIAGADSQRYLPSGSGKYKVRVTLKGCVSGFSNEFYYLVTGIALVGDDQYIKIYPNPISSTQGLYIDWKLKNATNGIRVRVKNMVGQEIFVTQITSDHDKIAMPTAPGVYVIDVYWGKTNRKTFEVIRN